VSQDNLSLRDRLATSAAHLRKAKAARIESERANGIERQKAAQYKEILQILLDKQSEMDKRIKNFGTIERAWSDLQRSHSLCKTKEEIQELIRQETQVLENQNQEIKKSIKIDGLMAKELEKLQELILNLAISAQELTEVSLKTTSQQQRQNDNLINLCLIEF